MTLALGAKRLAKVNQCSELWSRKVIQSHRSVGWSALTRSVSVFSMYPIHYSPPVQGDGGRTGSVITQQPEEAVREMNWEPVLPMLNTASRVTTRDIIVIVSCNAIHSLLQYGGHTPALPPHVHHTLMSLWSTQLHSIYSKWLYTLLYYCISVFMY